MTAFVWCAGGAGVRLPHEACVAAHQQPRLHCDRGIAARHLPQGPDPCHRPIRSRGRHRARVSREHRYTLRFTVELNAVENMFTDLSEFELNQVNAKTSMKLSQSIIDLFNLDWFWTSSSDTGVIIVIYNKKKNIVIKEPLTEININWDKIWNTLF